jgi:hypothetical protein
MTGHKRTAAAIASLVACVAMLLVAANASAVVHVTTTELPVMGPTTENVAVVSTGDAALGPGNSNYAVSPVATDVADWFNQDVKFSEPVSSPRLVDTIDGDDDITVTDEWWAFSTNNTMWGPATHNAIGTPVVVQNEGIYSVSASGTDVDAPGVASGTVKFGIDKTPPRVVTDLPALPLSHPDGIVAFNVAGTVTLTETDALSGAEHLLYSVDNSPVDFRWDNAGTEAGAPLVVPVTVATAGFHTLSWRAFDNAGNVESGSVVFFVRPVNFVPRISLRISQSGARNRSVRFSGEISPMATDQTLKITVQRKVGKSWRSYATYTSMFPAYGDDYSVAKTFARADTFRAWVTCGGGMSSVKTFKTR